MLLFKDLLERAACAFFSVGRAGTNSTLSAPASVLPSWLCFQQSAEHNSKIYCSSVILYTAVQSIMETAMLSNLGTPDLSEQHFPLWGVALLCRLSNLWYNSTTYAINRCSLSERVAESVHLQFWALTWSVCDWLKKWTLTLDNPPFPSLPFPPPEERTIQLFH